VPGILDRFAVADLGHPPNSSAPQSRILVAIPPAVDRSLNQPSLAAKAGVEFGQSPSHRVAFRLVHQAISSVLILVAARSRVDAVLRLELRTQSIHVHGLHIASDGVLHLDTVARVFKCNPLNPVIILSNNQGGCGWNGTGRSIWVDTVPATAWNIVLLHLRSIGWMLWGTERGGGSGDLRYMRLHLCSWAIRHVLLGMLLGMLLHLMLSRRM